MNARHMVTIGIARQASQNLQNRLEIPNSLRRNRTRSVLPTAIIGIVPRAWMNQRDRPSLLAPKRKPVRNVRLMVIIGTARRESTSQIRLPLRPVVIHQPSPARPALAGQPIYSSLCRV